MTAKMREPTWWSRTPSTAWERVKEAVRRDWEQTKHDLHRGGHELNQSIRDTLRQASGRESIPAHERPNPPHVIGDLAEVEEPIAFGVTAYTHYGELYPTWNSELEALLARDWERSSAGSVRPWTKVRDWVRRGYVRPTGQHH